MAKPVKVIVLGDSKDAQKAFRDIAKEADKTQKPLAEFGEKLGGFATAAAGVALGVGVAVAGLFAKGFADGLNTEAATDKLAAQLDLSERAAERSGEVAKDVFRGAWGESIDEVSEAISLLHSRGLVDLEKASDDVVRGLAEDALTVADVWDQDVNEVIRAAAALLDSDLADSADEAFDIITTGLTEGADLNGDFLDSLFEYSTHFEGAGLSAEQFVNGLLAGTEAGMLGVDKVADAVGELGKKVMEEGGAVEAALEDLGLDAEDVARAFARGGEAAEEASLAVLTGLANLTDPLEQKRLAIALMGTQYEDLGVVGPEVLQALANETLEVRDTADVAGVAYDNTATRIEEFKRRGLGALEEVVAGFLSGLGVGGEAGSINAGLDDLNTWIGENEEQIREWGEEWGTTMATMWEDAQPILEWLADFLAKGSEVAATTQAEWEALAAMWRGVDDWFNDSFMPTIAHIGDAFEVVGQIAAAAIKAPLNAVIDAWNNLSIPGFFLDMPSPIPDISWAGWNSPNIPRLHEGGIVPGLPGQEVLTILEAGERVTPAGAAGVLDGATLIFQGLPESLAADVGRSIGFEIRWATG